jgi:hypothetical protein
LSISATQLSRIRKKMSGWCFFTYVNVFGNERL